MLGDIDLVARDVLQPLLCLINFISDLSIEKAYDHRPDFVILSSLESMRKLQDPVAAP